MYKANLMIYNARTQQLSCIIIMIIIITVIIIIIIIFDSHLFLYN